uniref:Uncharacterized protein n=1 Tax=Lepeophtheirus salmonis TaxID=72036 RepID=A0A0K2UHD8_LEPSM
MSSSRGLVRFINKNICLMSTATKYFLHFTFRISSIICETIFLPFICSLFKDLVLSLTSHKDAFTSIVHFVESLSRRKTGLDIKKYQGCLVIISKVHKFKL